MKLDNGMNMNNKYYTPEIEEFHVGFEYEQFGKYTEFKVGLNTAGYYSKIGETIETIGWKPKLCDEFDFKDLEEYLEKGLIRTKYLDQEDIESLGFYLNYRFEDKLLFVNCNDFSTIVDSSNKIVEEKALKLYTVRLESNQTVTIRGWLHYDPIFFQGIIKNKSELKQILKMIGHDSK